jgi:site-specific DNA recombinase
MLRLLDDARSRRIQAAVTVEMERFSRSESLFDWLVIKQAFRQGRVRFGTPQQLYDPADTEDDVLADLFGALAKREKRKILQRTMRGKLEAARRGRHVGASVPFGYVKTAPGQVAVHEPSAEVVRLIFRLLLGGLGTAGIVRELAARGIPSPAGRRVWPRATVAKILRGQAYVGLGTFNRLERLRGEDGRRRRRVRPESDWVAVPLPRVVPDEVFRLAQEQLRRNAELAPRNQRRFHLLKGLVRCGLCGGAMVGRPNHGRGCYVCARACGPVPEARCRFVPVAAEELEEAVWGQVVAALRDPEAVLEAARQHRESRVGERDELLIRLEAVRAALAEIPAQRERAQRLYRDGYASIEETKASLDELSRRQRALGGERESLEARLSSRTTDEAEAARLEELVARIGHRLDGLDREERFRAVHAIVRRVVVKSRGELEIEALVPLGAGRYAHTAWRQAVRSGR